MLGGDFFLHIFFVVPVCQYLLKPNPKWTRARGFVYAISFLAAIALVSEYQVFLHQPPNYYQLLDCTRSSSTAELKKSYRTQSLLLHPDKNPNNPHAQEQFTRLQQAYDVLNDPQQRETYDKFGEDGLRRTKSETSILMNIATFYIIWGMLTFVLTLGKDSAAGRNWIFTGMIVMIICEFQMIFGDWDPLKPLFPRTTIYEKIAALHTLFPAFMNGCRIISQSIFIDYEQQTQMILAAVLQSNQEMLRGLAQLNASLDRKAGKKAGAPPGVGVGGTTTDDGFDGLGVEEVAGKAGADLPLGVRLRRQKAEGDKIRVQMASNAEKSSRSIPPWAIMVGMYVLFNYVLK